MSNPISALNELNPSGCVEYTFEPVKDGFKCRVSLLKDREVFDCYGIGQKKHDAKIQAARRMVALIKLLFPMVPLALYNRTTSLGATYTFIQSFSPTGRYIGLQIKEIRSGSVYLYVNEGAKNYCVLSSPSYRPESVLSPECPMELLNDPIRFTDWSQGPVTQAQEAYLSKRIEMYMASRS